MTNRPHHDYRELATHLHAAAVSDALDALGSRDHLVGPAVRPAGRLRTPLVGRAATALAVPVATPPARPYATLLEAMGKLGEGDVIVVAGRDGDTRSAVFGGLLATAARARGAAGCIVAGAIRDTAELERLEFPTFAVSYSPADSLGRDEVVEYGVAVRCGETTVEPGDLIVADHDGVVVVPAELEQEAVERALAKVAGEGEVRAELARGLPVAAAFERYGIL